MHSCDGLFQSSRRIYTYVTIPGILLQKRKYHLADRFLDMQKWLINSKKTQPDQSAPIAQADPNRNFLKLY